MLTDSELERLFVPIALRAGLGRPLTRQAHTAAGLTPLRFTHYQVRYRPGYTEAILRRTARHRTALSARAGEQPQPATSPTVMLIGPQSRSPSSSVQTSAAVWGPGASTWLSAVRAIVAPAGWFGTVVDRSEFT